MATEAGPPCWADALACPPLAGQDPAQHARELLARAAASVARAGGKGKGGVASVGLVDHVFVLVRLALDDRPSSPVADRLQPSGNAPEAEKIFRSSLAPGALALVPKLVAALQPRQADGASGDQNPESAVQEKEQHGYQKGGESGGGLQGAVVRAAGHLTAMEQLVTRQNNTPALLMAHNGLAKLLKNNWPWLVGGVVDAPRLLSRLCEIYRDGLEQLKVALAQAQAKHVACLQSSSSAGSGEASTGAETAHLKKFGKLLATFGTRMACLLRHLGPECPPQDRREAYRLYAKAAAAVYPGLLASRRSQGGVDTGAAAATGSGSTAASCGVAGGIIYPKAVEAFLSTTDRPPCCQTPNNNAGVASAAPSVVTTATRMGAKGGVLMSGDPASSYGGGGATNNVPEEAAGAARIGALGSTRRNDDEGVMSESPVPCRCYEGAGPFSGRRHDPWEALEALRPPSRRRPPPPPTSSCRTRGSTTDRSLHDHGKASAGDPDSKAEGGDANRDAHDSGESSTAAAADPLGAVLLLCEVLRRSDKQRTSSAPAAAAVPTVLRRQRESCCCTWVLDHLAGLFPGWVDVASGADAATDDADSGGSASVSGRGAASALCDEVATALGLFVCRRALDGEFQEAQVQLIEGCACHPHPLCREAWVGALKVFLQRCDPAAQGICVQGLTDAALDPRVSRRCRRRLARALASVCAAGGAGTAAAACDPAPLLFPGARSVVIKSCLSRLQEGNEEAGSGDGRGGGLCGDWSVGGGSGGGACALDLFRSLPPSCLILEAIGGDGVEELTAVSVSFARKVATDYLGGRTSTSRGGDLPDGRSILGIGDSGTGGRGSTNESQQTEESFAAAARFLAARPKPVMSGGPHANRFARGTGKAAASGGGKNRALASVQEGAREVGAQVGGLLATGRLTGGGLSGRTMSAIMRLMAKTDASRIPPLCALIANDAKAGTEGGEALLALAEGLSSVGLRQHQRAGDVWKTVLQDGFAALFASRLWPVTTAAMEALEAVARCVDPSIAQLLPRQIPDNRLAAFKNRLAKRPVCLDGGTPIELEDIHGRGSEDTRILLAAAVALSERTTSSALAVKSQQVFLREGGDLSVLAGLLGSTVTGVRQLSEQEGGGVCLTLQPAEEHL